MTEELRQEYKELFETCVTRVYDSKGNETGYVDAVNGFIGSLMRGVNRYEKVEYMTHVPWFVIGLIHGMECSFRFDQHLHNGDPLTRRTVQVPAGRPPKEVGDPPFDWEVSAIDALQYDRLTAWTDWSIAGICFKLEGFNGWGYRKHHINSPYLWSMSNHYERGKYVADGLWDGDAVSKQVGAITALHQMVVDHQVALDAQPA